MRRLFFGLLCLVLAGPHTLAVDYQKLDRQLVKEPAYQSGQPRYALLLFGREAQLRVWAVLDGKTFYLDRDGNGDLTGKDERFASRENCTNVILTDPDGKTKYLITDVGGYEDTKPVPRSALMVSVTVQGPVQYQQYCDVSLASSPAKAGMAHFHGPLTAQAQTINWKLLPGTALQVGEAETDVRMLVGTFDEKAGCWTVVRSHEGDKSAFPEGIHPRVAIAWPAAKPGSPVIKEQVTLKKFC